MSTKSTLCTIQLSHKEAVVGCIVMHGNKFVLRMRDVYLYVQKL